MEPLGHTESILSIEPIENMAFSERKRVFFSTKLEMVLKSSFPGGKYTPRMVEEILPNDRF